MIRFRDKILEDYFIDPETAVITNSKGEVQETSIRKNGRTYFKGMAVHKIQAHTYLGYKPGYDIHHLDENKMNNSLSNLVYLTRSEHVKIHNETRVFSEETRKKMSIVQKGKKLSEEARNNISESKKGEKNPMYGKKGTKNHNYGKMWITNGIQQRRIHFDEEIPEGFVRGRIK